MEYDKTLILLKLGMLRLFFPQLQRYFPTLADRLSPSLFLTPPRFPETWPERNLRKEAVVEFIEINGKKTAIYSWGKGDPVLLIHGWAGRAANFSHFIRELVKAGYRALSFDAPAHGISTGKKTHLLEFMEAANAIAERHGALSACIGHSLGGVAAYLLASRGMKTKALITLGCPSRENDIFHTFFVHRLNGTLQSVPYLKKWILTHLNFDFDKTFPLHKHPLQDPSSLFIIHDQEDKESNIKESSLLHEANQGSSLYITQGLGHIKTLKDPTVIEKTLAFTKLQNKGPFFNLPP